MQCERRRGDKAWSVNQGRKQASQSTSSWARCVRTTTVLLACMSLVTVAFHGRAAADEPAAAGAPTATNTKVKSTAELFPDSTIAYVELSDPRQLVAGVFDHPVAAKLQTDDRYRPLLATPEYAKFRFGLGLVELSLGMTWRRAVEQAMGGGAAVGMDGRTGAAAIAVQALDPLILERLRDFAFKTVRDEARKQEKPNPVETTEYRGVSVHRFDKLKIATVGPWLVATDNDELGKSLVDRLLDGPGDKSLAADPAFREARAARPGTPLVWSCLRLDRLRESGRAAGLVAGKAENPVAELLAGGVLEAMRKASHLTASLEKQGDSFVLSASLPFEPAWVPQEREYFFGEASRGRAPGVLRPTGSLLHIAAYRDLAALWNSAPDLFDEKTNAEINQANANLSTLFSGRDFGQDVLGSLGPAWQLVVARQDYTQALSIPQIKLPAGAVVADLRDPEKMRREWKVTFQSLIGFLNIVGSMQGQPPLELDSEKIDGIQLVTASYAPPQEGKKPAAGSLHYNFSPSLALIDSRLVLASTRSLALELARLKPAEQPGQAVAAKANETPAKEGESGVNSLIALDAQTVREALKDNREQLVAQNMLEKGHGRGDAEREIDALLMLSELVRNLDAQLNLAGGRLELRARLGL
jgi:hypothetical protein